MKDTNFSTTEDTISKSMSGNNSGESGTTTTARLATAAHSAVDIAAANLEHAEKSLREAREAAGQKVHDRARQARYFSEDARDTVKAYIDLYPLRSVGIALAAGFLISSALKK